MVELEILPSYMLVFIVYSSSRQHPMPGAAERHLLTQGAQELAREESVVHTLICTSSARLEFDI